MASIAIVRGMFGTAPRVVVRYVLLALLFALAVLFQIGSTRVILRHVPADFPTFGPNSISTSVGIVDSKAAAAGLHKGDILVAINGRPCTGYAVYLEEILNAVPGKALAVTVRSPGSNSQSRTILLPVTPGRSWLDTKAILIPLFVLMPACCIALGFWVVLVRLGDWSAWLLLGVLLGFSQLLSGGFTVESWGPGLLKFTAGYTNLMTALVLPISMFLFGFYFPEPLPLFQRPPWKWLPWIVIGPYVVLELAGEVLFVGALTDYSSVAPLHRILHPLLVVFRIYPFVLVSGFFFFIFSKSYRDISPDSRRRLRLLSWGATVAFTPALLLVLTGWLRGRYEFPDWLTSIVIVLFALFPLTLAYVIVVQRAMDVRVVVRQGLRYALAKNGVRVLQALAILLVILTTMALIEQNRYRPQKIVVIAVGLVAIFTIRRMTEKIGVRIDRRFFREAYDAEKVLAELSDGVRGMVDARSLIETVAERISKTLHISRVAVLLGGGGPYRPAYALGYGAAPDVAFPAGGGTAKLLQKQKEPARVYFDDPNSWLYREPEMTEEDRSKLTELSTELLLPLSTRDKLLGFISLGPKLSDEPYSRTDLRLLKSVAAQTGLALENADLISAIADEVAQRERLNREVEIAREVQERLFPQTLPPIAGIAYAGACRSALGVGGDYYDFLALPAGKLGIAIGDVSGKGIAAALMMASLQASLRSEATRASDNLSAMMGSVNRLVYEASSSNRYATFFYGQYDPLSRQLTYVNAGHNPPMLFHSCNGECHASRLEACGTVVGLLEDALYQQATLAIAPGDVLIAFTDGINEAMNAAEDEWGEERLIQTVKSCLGLPPAEIIACIMRNADTFVAGAKQNDDMTLIVLCAQPDPGK